MDLFKVRDVWLVSSHFLREEGNGNWLGGWEEQCFLWPLFSSLSSSPLLPLNPTPSMDAYPSSVVEVVSASSSTCAFVTQLFLWLHCIWFFFSFLPVQSWSGPGIACISYFVTSHLLSQGLWNFKIVACWTELETQCCLNYPVCGIDFKIWDVK